MKRDRLKTGLIMAVAFLIPVVWAALLVAPYIYDGLDGIVGGLMAGLEDPLQVAWHENSLRTIFFCVFVYAIVILAWVASLRNTRPGEEHGSAKWGKAKRINKKYADPDFTRNKILTKNVRIGFNSYKHRRNLNVLICGGSGAGKTRFYAKPNAMNCNTSMVILDPKGEIARDTGNLFKEKGYTVKVLDLINMWKSHCYNPFVYLRDDNDIQRLVTNLFKATTPKGSQVQDPFWDTAASMLLLALIFYLKHEAPAEEQNFAMVMEMIRYGEVREDDDEYHSPLDELFDRLATRNPDHIALKYYKGYKSGSGKTLKSIQITLISRIEKFNLEGLASLTITDDLNLERMGEEKTVLFIIIPDNDTSFNFLVSILYTQLLQQLFHAADYKHGGSLPVPVHFIMDEFANVSLPDDFEKILSVMRSRGVSVSIILQNLAQLKALFDKQWESIVGNCDEFLFLGGNEDSTFKFVSERLGKETLDTTTYGKTTGRSGSNSTNYQNTGRELMTAAEVGQMDNKYALLFIRGELPIKDEKYDIMQHPNVGGTTDGGGAAFYHGAAKQAVSSISVVGGSGADDNAITIDLDALGVDLADLGLEVMSSEEWEQFFEQVPN